jgi:hypothetical protein
MSDWSPKIEVVRHGREQEPVIVIDGCSPDPEELIEEAAKLEFAPNGPYFPGVRANVPPDVVRDMREAIADLL